MRKLSWRASGSAARSVCWMFDHVWKPDGGRPCPKGCNDCTQTVFRCRRCGVYDYGDEGGPAHDECEVCPWEDDKEGKTL